MKSRLLPLAAIILAALWPLSAAGQTDPQAAWVALTQANFDPQKVATVSDVVLERDLGRIVLRSGTMGFGQLINGRPWYAAFRGQGVFSLSSKLPLEVQQLTFYTGQGSLDVEFSEAIFFFSDSLFEEVNQKAQFGAGDTAGVQAVFASRYKTLLDFGLDHRDRLLRAALAETPPPAYLHAQLKTSKHGWLLFEFDSADLEEVYLGRWDSGWRNIDTWCHFPAGGRTPQEVFQNPNARDSFEIKSYKLDVTVEKDATLKGQAEVKLVALWPGQRALLFGLIPNLQVSSVTDAGGATLTYFQPPDPKDKYFFDSSVTVVLPTPTERGQELTLRFAYAGKRVVTREGGSVYFASSFGWYPFGGGDEFTHRYHFDITLRVPKGLDAVAIGFKADEERKEGNYMVTRWETDVPVAVAGFAFGKYYIREQQATDRTVVQTFVNKEPDQYLRDLQLAVSDPFGSGDESGPEGAALEAIQPARLGPTILQEVTNSLKVFEEYFGPYPYKKLAVSNIPWSYGQGWPSLLYVSTLTFMDSTQRHALFGGRLSAQDQINITDRFRAHETSHQWWGHVVGWKSYHDQWLSEGFAEFSGLLYAQARRGRNEYLAGLRLNRESLLNKDREGAVIDDIGPIYAGFRLSSGKHPGGYSVLVYDKGGWVLHMLRMLLFDTRAPDPDHRFKAMMKDFTKTFYNQAASTVDFQHIAEKHMIQEMSVDSRRSLDWFFNQWVYGTGIPHYTLSYQLEPQGTGVRLRGSIKQSRVPPNFVMVVPMYAYAGERIIRLGFIRVTGEETPFDVNLPIPIDKVTLNEWEDVLCTWETK